LLVIRFGRFLELVGSQYGAVLGFPAFRIPATVRDAQFYCDIEACAVDARLGAGDDFRW